MKRKSKKLKPHEWHVVYELQLILNLTMKLLTKKDLEEILYALLA